MNTQNAAVKMALGQLYTNKVQDSRMLNLFVETPREAYVPENLKGSAYVDEDLQVAPGRTLLAPLTFARMLEEANIQASDQVLVIGCLQGYAAALCAKLAAHVTAIECDASLVDAAENNLRLQGADNVDVQLVSSLAEGYAAKAPYDVIVIAGAVYDIPASLVAQLKTGGRLVTIRAQVSRPGTSLSMGHAVLVSKTECAASERICFDVAAGLLPGFAKPSHFTL